MSNGYIGGIVALFVVYSLLHHKKTAFYESDETDSKCESDGQVKFLPEEEQNEIYKCFQDTIVINNCNETDKYSLLTGYCNNLDNPLWGGALTSYKRITETYYDGDIGLRKGVNGEELPLARKISTEILSNKKPLSRNKTMLLTTFGQIVAHDVASETVKPGDDCCTEVERGTEDFANSCCPLDIPDDDPFYSKINVSCITSRRHQNTYLDLGCTMLKRSYPLTRVSSYLDLSFLYGYDEATNELFREFVGGRMLANYTEDGPMLLLQEGGCAAHAKVLAQPICFRAVDARINQNPEVSVYTTIFLRSHNFIARELEKLHPEWNDTILFGEARRINIATYQRVVYNEFLPALLGKENCEKRGLSEEKDGYSDQYDPQVNAHTIVSFTTGVYRSFHTLQTGNVTLRNNNYEPTGSYRTADHMNNQAFLVTVPHSFTQIINGFSRNRAIDRIGKYAAPDLLNLCFKNEAMDTITDLFAIDITRGRDDGIPPYNEMRKYCGLCPITSFDQLDDTRPDIARKLEKLYDSVDDLDLLVGVYLETPNPNSLFGPTAQCIFEEAFSRYKKGDRFFYEFNNEHVSFTEEQLKAIKQVTFSSFVCVAQNNSELQQQVDSFHQPSAINPTKSCADIPFVNLSSF